VSSRIAIFTGTATVQQLKNEIDRDAANWQPRSPRSASPAIELQPKRIRVQSADQLEPSHKSLELSKVVNQAMAAAHSHDEHHNTNVAGTRRQSVVASNLQREGSTTLIDTSEASKHEVFRRSLFIFAHDNPIRQHCLHALDTRAWHWGLRIVIVLNIVCLAIQATRVNVGYENRYDTYYYVLTALNAIFAALFVLEMMVKVIAHGVYLTDEHAYIRQPGNVVDLFIVIVSCMTIEQNRWSLRLFRPLKLITGAFSGLSVLFSSMVYALRDLKDAVILLFSVLWLISLAGHQLYSSTLTNRCFEVDPVTGAVASIPVDGPAQYGQPCTSISLLFGIGGRDCPGTQVCLDTGQNPDAGVTSYDSSIQSFLTNIIAISGEGWSTTTYYLDDADSTFSEIYFIVLMMLCYQFLMQLIIVLMTARFEESKQQVAENYIKEKTAREGRRRMLRGVRSPPADAQHKLTRSASDPALPVAVDHADSKDEHPAILRSVSVDDLNAHIHSPRKPTTVDQLQVDSNQSTLTDISAFSLTSPVKHTQKSFSLRDTATVVNTHVGNSITATGRVLLSGGKVVMAGLQRLESTAGPKYQPVRLHIRRFLNPYGEYFFGAITIANVGLLASIHYGMSQSLFDAINISNIAFTVFFWVELVIKLAVYGPREYWLGYTTLAKTEEDRLDPVASTASLATTSTAFTSSPVDTGVALGTAKRRIYPYANWLDTVVVLSSTIELVINSANNSGLSSLRAVRLIRLYNLLAAWRPVQQILSSLAASMRELFNFSLILFLFLLMFAIGGVELFGNRLDDRSNFDTLWYSAVTTFQITTPENVNGVIIDAAANVGLASVTYLVVIYMIGHWVLEALFLAILLSNFDASDRYDTKLHLKAKFTHFMQRARTRMQQVKYGKRSQPSQTTDQPTNSVQISVDSPDGNQLQISTHSPTSNKLRAPQFMLSIDTAAAVGDGRNNEGNVTSASGSGSSSARLRTPTHEPLSASHNRMHRGSTAPISPIAALPAFNFHNNLPIPHRKLDTQRVETVTHQPSNVDLLNRWRRWCHKLLKTKLASLIQFSVTILSLAHIAMAAERFPPNLQTDTTDQVLHYLNFFILAYLTLELVCKLALEGVWRKGGYLRDNFNWIELVVWVDLILMVTHPHNDVVVAIQCLRALRLITYFSSSRMVTKAFVGALYKLTSLIIFCFIFIFTFAIIAVTFYAGRMQLCQPLPGAVSIDSSIESPVCNSCIYLPLNQDECNVAAGGIWANPIYMSNWDNVLSASLGIFELSTEENWPGTMWATVDSTNPTYQPVINNDPVTCLFFVIVIMIASWFIKNAFVAVVVESFLANWNYLTGSDSLTEIQARWLQLYQRMANNAPESRYVRPKFSWFGVTGLQIRLHLFRWVTSRKFELAVYGIIIANIILYSLEYQSMPYAFQFTIFRLIDVITVLYGLELFVTITAVGWRQYFHSNWNKVCSTPLP